MANKATATAAADAVATTELAIQSQQDSPLMKLPTELHLKIYAFAFDYTVVDVASHAAKVASDCVDNHPDEDFEDIMRPIGPPDYKADYQIFIGPLALLHINQALRRESLDVLPALAKAHENKFPNHRMFFWTCGDPSESFGRLFVNEEARQHFLLSSRLRWADVHRTKYQRDWTSMICKALSLVALHMSGSHD